MNLEPIPRLRRPGVDLFRREAQRAPRPVVLTGVADDWPALRSWSPAWLRERFGHCRARTYVMPGGKIQRDPRSGFAIRHMTVAEYVDQLDDDAPGYYWRAHLPGELGALLDDVRTPAYCRGGLALRRNLWVSGAGTVTHLHQDIPHNLLAQIHGTKRFVLFHARDAARVYRYSRLSTTPHLARLDPDAPDFDRYPRARGVTGWTATLGPGDMLYIPPRFWHYARTEQTSISINFWWFPVLALPLLYAGTAYKRLRGLEI